MLIGIDGNEANQAKRVGVGEYGFQLFTQLKAQGSRLKAQGQNLKFKIYLKEHPLEDLPGETRWWRYKVVRPKFLWTQIGLPIALFRDRPWPDVFFTPTHYAPRFCPCPRVISIMDLSFLRFPEMFKKEDLWKLNSWTAYSVKKAKKILAISKSTRDDIIKYYKVPKEKITVVYPGVKSLKPRFSKKGSGRVALMSDVKSEIKKVKKKYGIEGDYILYVGTLQPRKNLVKLIEAFRKQKTKNKKQKTNIKALKLVIAGKKGWMYRQIFQKVKDLNLFKKVIFTGYVPDEELPALYKGAKCFVLVSLYEGFGLPALEALSFGVPVVVSNVSSLPEIVGDAGILVDPYSVEDIARGISEVLNFDTFKYRSVVKKGLKQAKKFSWERCARGTLKVLIEAARLKSEIRNPKF